MFARTTLQTLLVKTYSNFLQSVSTCKLLPILKASILKKVFRRLEVCLEPCYTAQSADLVAFTEENLNGKLLFCAVLKIYDGKKAPLEMSDWVLNTILKLLSVFAKKKAIHA